MSYVALRFDSDAAGAEAWSDALLAVGALSVDVSDPHAGSPHEFALYAEPGSGAAALWPHSRLTVLFAAESDSVAALEAAANMLSRPAPRYTTEVVEERDWVRATQAQFGPIRITDALWIVPSWCAPPQPGAVNITVDPGLAFGTGSHATTRLCLLWLAAHITGGEAVLDYGCGSGILAIAAAKLGARRVIGVDIDPQAIRTSRDNARANGVAAEFDQPDALPAGAYDIVIANILANPLILLAPVLAKRTRRGGRSALAGILVPQIGDVAAAYSRWFNIAPWRELDGWTLLAGERKPDA